MWHLEALNGHIAPSNMLEPQTLDQVSMGDAPLNPDGLKPAHAAIFRLASCSSGIACASDLQHLSVSHSSLPQDCQAVSLPSETLQCLEAQCLVTPRCIAMLKDSSRYGQIVNAKC